MAKSSQSLSLEAKRSFKIIFLGDSGVGKSSIIERFVYDRFNIQQQPTIGIDFLSKKYTFKNTNYRLQLWDSAGQQKFMSLIPTYLRDADCVIFVFDLTRNQSLEKIEKWINIYREHRIENSISMLCGNKSDLGEKIDKTLLKNITDKYKLPYQEVSALKDLDVGKLFGLVVEMLLIRNKDSKQAKDQTETAATTGRTILSGKKVEINKQQRRNCCC